jgi:hypothetical protein
MKRVLALLLAIAGLAVSLTGCEANQIDWRNRYYIVSGQSCLTNGSLTVKNGSGVVNGVRVSVVKTIYGDFTRDHVQDVAVVLGCASAVGGNQTGSEIQIFTRDAKPVMRLIAPGARANASFPPSFDLTNLFNSKLAPSGGDNLVTGVVSWKPTDPHCCPSVHTVYRWVWNGRGFYAKVNDLGTD